MIVDVVEVFPENFTFQLFITLWLYTPETGDSLKSDLFFNTVYCLFRLQTIHLQFNNMKTKKSHECEMFRICQLC